MRTDLEAIMLGGRGRERREHRREERHGGGDATHYRMRQKLVSVGDDYWIEDDQGQRVFKVDGKALRVRKTLIFEDAHGGKLLQIQERMLRVRDTMEIEDADGHSVATVRKAMITPLRERWTVKVADGPDLKVQGNILDHEYTIEDDDTTVAEVSKKWFRVADTYGVEVAPGQNPVLLLAVTAVLDTMAHAAR
ncbi:LURP-one-related/scramblase family protein [Actinoplanes sp. CA-030573]|uniref:LURP-one-related/scramblase family protein n=1 Tax=Actinoplanes sp. CA-030573 TaxID=3239898 RepID=UPI003D8CD099